MHEHHVLVIHTSEKLAYLLEARTCSVGRDAMNAIVLDAPSISRQQALFLRVPKAEGATYRLIDGNSEGTPSLNGTWINGKSSSSAELKTGDLITFGTKIRATYMVVPRSQANLERYLEAKQIHSIKDAPSDQKATVVAKL